MASSLSSSTSSSNEPPIFSISEKTKLVFHQACKIISRLWPRSDETTYPNRQRRRYRGCRLWRSQSADHLPLYINDHYLSEMQRIQTKDNRFSLGKTIISLTFQAVAGLAMAFRSSLSSSTSSSTGQSQEEDVSSVVPLDVVGVVMVIAFAAAFSGVFLKQAYPRAAYFFDMIGSLFVANGFFVMTSILIPKTLRWICWLACAFCLLVFSLAFIR